VRTGRRHDHDGLDIAGAAEALAGPDALDRRKVRPDHDGVVAGVQHALDQPPGVVERLHAPAVRRHDVRDASPGGAAGHDQDPGALRPQGAVDEPHRT